MSKRIFMVSIFMSVLLLSSGSFLTGKDFPVLKGPYLGQTPPGADPEIFAPGIISFGFHENGIVFSPDGNELLFAMSDSQFSFKTFVYLQRAGNIWTKPVIAPFSGEHYDHSAFFTPDGKKIFFSSKRPVSADSEPKKDLDVWVVEKKGHSWGRPVHLEGPLNTTSSEQITSIARDGTIYLRTNYAGKGKWAIYASRPVNGQYAAAEKLCEKINSGNGEGNPFISPDNTFLLFKSNRPGGFGKSDIYVSFRQKDNSWGESVNLGPKVNSPGYELEPRLSPDGKFLFYSSFRRPDPKVFRGKTYKELMTLYRDPRNGYATLYWVDAGIIRGLQPKSGNPQALFIEVLASK